MSQSDKGNRGNRKQFINTIPVVIVAAALVLSGCGAEKTVQSEVTVTAESATPANEGTTQAEVAATAESAASTNEVMSQPEAAVTAESAAPANEVSAENLYADKLAEIKKFLDTKDEDLDPASIPDEFGGIEEVKSFSEDPLNALGYCIEDLSGDGVPELSVAGIDPETVVANDEPSEANLSGAGESGTGVVAMESESEAGTPGTYVLALYTIADGAVKPVLTGWARNSYLWQGGGDFVYQGSSSAFSSAYGKCHLTEDGSTIVWESFAFSDALNDDMTEIGYFRNETGAWDKDASTPITEDEFLAGEPDGTGAKLKLQSFSKL